MGGSHPWPELMAGMANRRKLPGNQLSGPLPQEWSTCAKLKYMELQDNQLSGTLPVQLDLVLSELTVFSISNNTLDEAALFEMAAKQPHGAQWTLYVGPIPTAPLNSSPAQIQTSVAACLHLKACLAARPSDVKGKVSPRGIQLRGATPVCCFCRTPQREPPRRDPPPSEAVSHPPPPPSPLDTRLFDSTGNQPPSVTGSAVIADVLCCGRLESLWTERRDLYCREGNRACRQCRVQHLGDERMEGWLADSWLGSREGQNPGSVARMGGGETIGTEGGCSGGEAAAGEGRGRQRWRLTQGSNRWPYQAVGWPRLRRDVRG